MKRSEVDANWTLCFRRRFLGLEECWQQLESAVESDDVVVDDENDGGLKEVGKKRKGSGTFVVLNMLVGLWAVGVGISQGFVGGIPFNLRRAADKFLFGLLFLNNGVLTQLTKMGLIKDRDEIDPDAEPILRIGL
mmetsp:Transcript_19947/g.30042  ORF Transcript_19947/g.30042 Transcript_19947/m.30042 type:complete len:135 (+) Transcript_19947:378-782(+)